ncbi:hypothetical protein PTTG_11929 [Puccinia triticina 1-1 BBBD Race 1]|uniref:HEME_HALOPEROXIDASE domain-containing protein n=2 Tax=Puccinia triticina TaxID=208348 RepID=A0A180H257_PUCT1|nr:uncharacterized protein PtA15_4A236 [Puccinia triticina]OAV99090.1 hypothetical protein PTTG_11929 [Puccinia triticina 1-1 BBBD Race 1]WAQ83787.1 hypothetical protein PtA15_4A236 [Puccinia triticina]WAR54629.1 hypothetical protein PtB15_4B246 [Puccinia triticina]
MQQDISQEKYSEQQPLLKDHGSGPDALHPYHRKMLGCPCPAVASMINHSYLNVENSNQKIPIHKLIAALVECYNFSWTFAILIVVVGTLRLGKVLGFSIKELGEHGKIEHDASMTRLDVDKGNALEPNPGLIDELFKSLDSGVDSKSKTMTLEDFAKKKLELEKQVTKYDYQSKSAVNFLGRGEVCLALQAHRHLGTGFDSPKAKDVNQDGAMEANTSWMRTWFLEERLPVELGWKRPASKITIRRTWGMMKEMKARQDRLSQKDEPGMGL